MFSTIAHQGEFATDEGREAQEGCGQDTEHSFVLLYEAFVALAASEKGVFQKHLFAGKAVLSSLLEQHDCLNPEAWYEGCPH